MQSIIIWPEEDTAPTEWLRQKQGLREQKKLLTLTFNYQKAEDKIFICKFSKMLSPSFIILRIQRLNDKQCRSG